MNTHIHIKEKHDNLVNLCDSILRTQCLPTEIKKEYGFGEMDVLCNKVYYEIKCNYNKKSAKKAIIQMERAIKYNQADYGFLVTYDGVYDLLKDKVIE